jgi:hypothetical protein
MAAGFAVTDVRAGDLLPLDLVVAATTVILLVRWM